MGIFPIIMNIIQFWLIDTIVKAKPAPSLTLDSDAPDALHPNDQDREPLFGVPSDDEDETPAHPYDLENPRPPSLSRSTSTVPTIDTAKSRTITPDPKSSNPGLVTPGDNVELHHYPPVTSGRTSPTAINPILNTKSHTGSQSLPAQPPSRSISGAVTPVSADEWADSWEESDDWDSHHPVKKPPAVDSAV
jgi:hypothetical protein